MTINFEAAVGWLRGSEGAPDLRSIRSGFYRQAFHPRRAYPRCCTACSAT